MQIKTHDTILEPLTPPNRAHSCDEYNRRATYRMLRPYRAFVIKARVSRTDRQDTPCANTGHTVAASRTNGNLYVMHSSVGYASSLSVYVTSENGLRGKNESPTRIQNLFMPIPGLTLSSAPWQPSI